MNAIPGWGDLLFSNGERINIVPSSAARFQIASETLRCINETGSTCIGSDEVGIKIIGVPLFPDLTSGESQSPNGNSIANGASKLVTTKKVVTRSCCATIDWHSQF